jgi:transposase
MAPFQGRRAEEVIAWCNSRPPAERHRVAVVVLEMSQTFFAAVKAVCGDHGHVSDRCQVVHQAVRALDEVVRSVQKQLAPEEAKALKQLRKRGLKASDQLNGDEGMARDEWQRRCPAWRETLAGVQDFRKWCDRKDAKPAREALLKRIERATPSTPEPLQRRAGTLTRWFEPMVCSMRNRDTNGRTEGFNNKIKLIQRMAYGLRNEHKRRKRIVAWCGAP